MAGYELIWIDNLYTTTRAQLHSPQAAFPIP